MKKLIIGGVIFTCNLLPVLAQSPELGTTTAIVTEVCQSQFDAISESGIEWVEVALNQCYRNIPLAEVESRIDTMSVYLDRAGLKVWSIHLPFSRSLDISVLDDKKRKENVEFIASMIRKSAIFSPHRLVLHPSSEPISNDVRMERINNSVESIRMLNFVAEEIGATLCVENLPRTCLGNTPEELISIVDAVPGVGICFDTNHYFQGSIDHFLDIAGNRIKTLHCSDYDLVNECHWLPTQGDINWSSLLKRLQELQYEGVFMYEAIKDRNTNKRLTPLQLVQSYKVIELVYDKEKK